MATQTKVPASRPATIAAPSRAVARRPLPSPDLSQKVKALEQRVRSLEQQLAALSEDAPEVVVLRTVTRKQAKKEILSLFAGGGTWYYSDVARELKLDLEQVVEICNELLEEQEIMVGAADTVRKG